MRRKRERSATAKSKASPEKKIEKVRRTRGRRRKQSTSSGNDSSEETIAALVPEKVIEPAQSEEPPNIEESPQETQDQVWQVKTTEGSGDGGEIQKLKICLKRPPSTPEAGDRSPRSKRKHTRATSSSDSTIVDTPDEKKKTRYRTRRSACDSSETSEKGNDSEMNVHKESVVVDSDAAKKTEEPEKEQDVQTESTLVTIVLEDDSESKDAPTESSEIVPEVSKSEMSDEVTIVLDEAEKEENDVKTKDSVTSEVSQEPTSSELTTETVEVKQTLTEVEIDSSAVKEDSSEDKEVVPQVKESLSEVQNESTTGEIVQNVVCSKIADTSMSETCSSTVDEVHVESKPSDNESDVDCKPSDKISDVESKPSDKISDVESKPSDKNSDEESKLSDKISDVESKPSDKISDVESKPSDKILDVESRPSDKMLDLENKPSDKISDVANKPSDNILDVESKPSDNISKETDSNNESIQEKHDDTSNLEKDTTQEGSMAFDKSDILEIHAEESKADISDAEITEAQNDVPEKQPEPAINQESQDKVSKSEDKVVESVKENGEPPHNEIKLSTNEPDVVAQMDNLVKESSSQEQSENAAVLKKVPERSESSQVNTEASTNSNIVINRKRRWGSRPKLTTQKSITISTDVLKEIIPDVKPVEFEEVIEEKKQKRFEVAEKIERPILPKIVIDNTENVELKRNQEKTEVNKPVKEINNLTSSRKISIVKDSENAAVIRPPSPPKHKQSNILYITNLVRPFTLSQLRNLLQRTGRITENGFWIDKIKSKCFVIYENEDQAVETRHALHGVTWPVSNPKTLHVDFSTQEDFDQAKNNEENENNKVTSIPGTVEDWLREQDMKREKGELERPWERKTTREWDLGKNDKNKDKDKDRLQKDERLLEKRRHHTPERSPEPAKKFKKKEEAPAKLLDDLFKKTKTTPCIYWLPLSAETIAIKEEQRRQHMAEHERRLQELRRGSHRRH